VFTHTMYVSRRVSGSCRCCSHCSQYDASPT
jgi:hypothetical protein